MTTADEDAAARKIYLNAAADQIRAAIRNHNEPDGLDILRRMRRDGYRTEARTFMLALILGIHVPDVASDPGE